MARAEKSSFSCTKRLDIFCEKVHIYAQRRRGLEKDGWYLARHGSGHDIFRHPRIKGIITLPRHKTVSPGVAHSIAKKAGWPE